MKFSGVSPAAGQKTGQFNRKRNFGCGVFVWPCGVGIKANIEIRIMNVEGMYSVYFYKKTERSLRLVGVVAPTPRRAIQQIFNLQSSIFNSVLSGLGLSHPQIVQDQAHLERALSSFTGLRTPLSWKDRGSGCWCC
jgi:hypothetical protein